MRWDIDTLLLVPVSLRWLNGQTQDFDGTTPTTVIPAPENPQYNNDVAFAGGLNQLGVLPMGSGRPTLPDMAYAVQTLAAAQAPSIGGLQYQWKRYLTRRSWYIQTRISQMNFQVSIGRI